MKAVEFMLSKRPVLRTTLQPFVVAVNFRSGDAFKNYLASTSPFTIKFLNGGLPNKAVDKTSNV